MTTNATLITAIGEKSSRDHGIGHFCLQEQVVKSSFYFRRM